MQSVRLQYYKISSDSSPFSRGTKNPGRWCTRNAVVSNPTQLHKVASEYASTDSLKERSRDVRNYCPELKYSNIIFILLIKKLYTFYQELYKPTL